MITMHRDYTKALPKKHFSKEQLQQFREINLPAFLLWYDKGSVVFANGSYRLTDNQSVVLNGKWARDFAAEKSPTLTRQNPASDITAIEQICGLNFYQAAFAINDFLSSGTGANTPAVEKTLTVERLEREIDAGKYEPAGSSKTAWAYLTATRHIVPEVVRDYLKKDHLYIEPLPRGCNILFVITEPAKPLTICGFERCGVLSGSGYRYKGSIIAIPNTSFADVIESGQADRSRVFVFESAIDVMSFRSLIALGKVPFPQNERWVLLSLRGLHRQMLLNRLDFDGAKAEIVLCVDNDEAGEQFCDNVIRHEQGTGRAIYTLRDVLKGCGAKDWNDLLSNRLTSVLTPIVPTPITLKP